MRIDYRGKNLEENRDYCEAIISYDETKEEELADDIYDILVRKGWTLECEYGMICVGLYNRDEYNELLEDYKKAKRGVK